MSAWELLEDYLGTLERRLWWLTWTRGLTIAGACALGVTVALVLFANRFAFADNAVTLARVLLFVAVGAALSLGLAIPMVRLNRRRIAARAERHFPEFRERLITFADRSASGIPDPFLELLAADTLEVAGRSEPRRLVPPAWVAGFASAGALAVGLLLWLILAGPGFLGYGSSLLWAGPPRQGSKPYYDLIVTPGDLTVRRRADQLVTAQPVGFQPPAVRLFARYQGASKWEQLAMLSQPRGAGHEFLFSGLPESVEYYIEAGSLRSRTYKLSVIDLAGVKRIKVTYRFPAWLSTQPVVEDPGGDLRGVAGTRATVQVETDKPLANGILELDDGSRMPLARREGNWQEANVTISRDGAYHIAALEGQQSVRLSEDFFIEAKQDSAPVVKIRRPGRDAKVSPIEEVPIEVEADDDFGLQQVELRYSVNGGPERSVPMSGKAGVKRADGSTLLALEDYQLVPGDVVSLYAMARDARNTTQTDIYFLEAQPFEREYTQSQQMAGGGQGGSGERDDNQISQRQKEIIAATWNQLRDRSGDRGKAEENARFLAGVQGQLQAQAQSLARRMRSRELSGTNQEFQNFVKNMEEATTAMGQAVEKLRGAKWRDALPPEQKALQNLMRAESIFRQIQVAFGSRGGGGGGGGGMGRDLESLFDLELDTEKNQYETGQGPQSAEQRSREVDEALEKLEQLARRQQELSAQQRQQQQNFQQRWQQEMLRREAEDLKRRVEQLSRGQQSSGQQSSSQQASGQQSSGQQSSSQQDPSRSSRLRQMAGATGTQGDPRLDKALERLRQATEDMRRAGSPDPKQSSLDSRRAAERLQEARDALRGLRQDESSAQLGDLTRRAQKLAEQQKDFAERMKQAFPGGEGQRPDYRKSTELGSEKQRMGEELDRLERGMQSAVRDLQSTQRQASSRLREALGEMQKNQVGLRMKVYGDYIKRGLGNYVAPREPALTEDLENLKNQLMQAQAASGKEGDKTGKMEKSLAGVERLREQLEQFARNQQGGSREPGQGQQEGQGQQQGPGQGQRSYGGQRRGYDGWSAMNRGDLPFTPGAGGERAWREGIRDLSELRRGMEESPEMRQELEALIREMQAIDPSRFPGNPELVERLRTQVLPAIEQLELQLRRQLEGDQTGQVRSGASQPVPPGYAEAVAEYYRRLSKGK